MREFSERAVKTLGWQSSQSQRHQGRGCGVSVDRQNTSMDARLRAGIMPEPIEIVDSDLGPVWSSAPSHYAHIFSGLQVSGHDNILEKWTQITSHYPFDGSVISTVFFFFLYTNLTAFLYFDPYNHKLRIDSLILHCLVSFKYKKKIQFVSFSLFSYYFISFRATRRALHGRWRVPPLDRGLPVWGTIWAFADSVPC